MRCYRLSNHAIEKRDELAPFHLTDLHPRGP
jgi:hypothetical protein